MKVNFEQKIKILFRYYDKDIEWPFDVFGRNQFIITEDDNCYSFGGNNNRLLGFDDNNAINEPKIVNQLSQKGIIDFANGLSHMIARTEDKKLYIWGYNDWGQLGNETNENCFVPQIVHKLSDEKIVDICCGFWHSLALTETGEVYSWGDNDSDK